MCVVQRLELVMKHL